jgi:hypothetical protein
MLRFIQKEPVSRGDFSFFDIVRVRILILSCLASSFAPINLNEKNEKDPTTHNCQVKDYFHIRIHNNTATTPPPTTTTIMNQGGEEHAVVGLERSVELRTKELVR